MKDRLSSRWKERGSRIENELARLVKEPPTGSRWAVALLCCFKTLKIDLCGAEIYGAARRKPFGFRKFWQRQFIKSPESFRSSTNAKSAFIGEPIAVEFVKGDEK